MQHNHTAQTCRPSAQRMARAAAEREYMALRDGLIREIMGDRYDYSLDDLLRMDVLQLERIARGN